MSSSESGIPRLHCAPSTMDLLGAELELADIDRKTYRLADAIKAHDGFSDPPAGPTATSWSTARRRSIF